MEHADNGDLYQQIVKHKRIHKLFKENLIWQYFTAVLSIYLTLLFPDAKRPESSSRFENLPSGSEICQYLPQ